MKPIILALIMSFVLSAGHAQRQSVEEANTQLNEHRHDKGHHRHRFRLWPFGHRHHHATRHHEHGGDDHNHNQNKKLQEHKK